MFKNTFQSGFLSILYSIGSKPLQIWDKKVRSCSISMLEPHSSFFAIYAILNTSFFHFQVRNGHIKRITDNDIQSLVLEVVGTNVRYKQRLLIIKEDAPLPYHISYIVAYLNQESQRKCISEDVFILLQFTLLHQNEATSCSEPYIFFISVRLTLPVPLTPRRRLESSYLSW